MLWCLLLAGITAIPQVWAAGVPELWALRLVNSAFLGSIIPDANLVIKEVVPTGRQGEAYGVASSATAVGFAIGPAGGGLLAAGFGFAASFLVPGLALVLGAPLSWAAHYLRPGTRSKDPRA